MPSVVNLPTHKRLYLPPPVTTLQTVSVSQANNSLAHGDNILMMLGKCILNQFFIEVLH